MKIVLAKVNPVVMSQEEFDDGNSPLICSGCSSYIPARILPCAECPKCGTYICEADVAIVPNSAMLLNDIAAEEFTWYHATNVEHWHERLTAGWDADLGEFDEDTIYVHLGTKESALERANDAYFRRRYGVKTVYLYELKLRKEAVLTKDIVKDENEWFFKVDEFSRKSIGGDAVRYVNRWEDHGSISLLADPRLLDVVDVSIIQPAESSMVA